VERDATALFMTGDVSGAKAALRTAFEHVEQSGERFWLAEPYRLRGEIASGQADPDNRPKRRPASFRRSKSRAAMKPASSNGEQQPISPPLAEDGFVKRPARAVGLTVAAIEGGVDTTDVRNARALLAEIV